MPSSSSARMTRTAISPRLATRTFENMGRVMLSGHGGAPRREGPREPCGDEDRLGGERPPGEADDHVAERGQARVAVPVVLERLPVAVGAPAVGLDDHPL